MRGDKARRKHGERRHEHDDERDLPPQDKEDDQHAENGDDARKELRKAQQQAVGKLFGVRQHDAGDLAVRMGVEELQRQALQFGKRVAADAGEQMVDNAVVDQAHGILRDERRRNAGADDKEQAEDRSIVHIPRSDHVIDRPPDEIGNGELRRHVDERAQDGDAQQGHIGLQVAQNGSECFAFVHSVPSFSCEAAISR